MSHTIYDLRSPLRLVLAATVSILTALLVLGGALSGSAGAAETSGSAAVTLGTGKAGKKLTRQGVRFKSVSPATRKNLSRGKARITAGAKEARVSQTAKVELRGGIVLKRGKHQFKLRGLVLKSDSKQTTVKGKLGGKLATVAKAKGSAVIDPVAGTVALGKGKFSLAGKAVGKARKKLKLNRAPKGVIGKLNIDVQAAFEDPYLSQCGLAADILTPGSLPSAAPLPELSGPVATTGNPITWGVKLSLRGYIGGIGKIVGLDGAVVNSLPFPGPPPTGFTFPDDAEYAANGAGAGDDQAVLKGSGSILFCNEPHGFRIALSNPTVVIDGANSRLIADLDTNTTPDIQTGVTEWTPAQRIDFATLDLSSIAPDTGTPGEITWADVPTNLTAAGADSLRLCEGPPMLSCAYVEGADFDPISVTVKTSG